MAIDASANLTLQISGGPTVSTLWTITGDVFDRATINVPKATTSLELLLQPSAGEKVLLFVVTSTLYSDKVSYKFEKTGPDLKLTQPHIISGGDLMKVINATPSTVTFKNSGPDDVTVDLIVLRLG